VGQGHQWDKLLALAEAHGVANRLAAALGRANSASVPEEFRHKLLERQRAQTLSSLSLIAEMIRILDQFGAAGIQALVLKGPALSLHAYGDAAARPYGDIDVLIRHRDVLSATNLMVALGFRAHVAPETIAAGKIPGEYSFSRPNTRIIVELHTERTLRYFPSPLSVEDLFTRSVRLEFDDRAIPTLSAEDTLVSMCTHGAKHFWERLMWIADVAAMLDRRADLDWNASAAIAEELGAQRIVHTGLLLARDLLSTQLPDSVQDRVCADAGAAALVRKIKTWLPCGEGASIGLLGRTLFRARMRRGVLAGLGYVARLSLSPTEDDWKKGHEQKQSPYRDAARRLVRLAGKYGSKTDR